MRRGHVVRVAGFAIAAQLQSAFVVDRAFQRRESAGFAQRQAVAACVERAARQRRHQAERVEAVQHAAAQRIHAADQRRVGEPGFDQARGLREHLGAGRTGGGDGDARAAQPGRGFDEGAERMRGVDARAVEVGGEAPIVEPRVGLLGRADAGSRGADHDRHAIRAAPFAQRGDGFHHPVLLEREPGQTVVAAVPVGESGRQHDVFHALDPADPALEQVAAGRAAEIVGAQSAAACAQRFELRIAPAPERGGRGVIADGERADRQRHSEIWIRKTGGKYSQRVVADRSESGARLRAWAAASFID